MPMAYHVVATEPLSERALTAETIAGLVKPFCSSVVSEPDITKAIEKAEGLCDNDCMICICGSLYLAGRAYEYLMKKAL